MVNHSKTQILFKDSPAGGWDLGILALYPTPLFRPTSAPGFCGSYAGVERHTRTVITAHCIAYESYASVF